MSEAVTYFVGHDDPSISIDRLSDLHEVLDVVHTMVMGAVNITEPPKSEMLRALESIMMRIEEIEPQ